MYCLNGSYAWNGHFTQWETIFHKIAHQKLCPHHSAIAFYPENTLSFQEINFNFALDFPNTDFSFIYKYVLDSW